VTTCALNGCRAVTIRRRADAAHTPVSTNVSAPPATTAAACVTSASVRTRASYSAVPTPADTFYAPPLPPRGGGHFGIARSVRPSVCLSVPCIDPCSSVRRVCCCGPGQAGDIDRLLHGRLSAETVSRCPLNTDLSLGAILSPTLGLISSQTARKDPPRALRTRRTPEFG